MAKNTQIVERPVGEILRLAEKATRKEYVLGEEWWDEELPKEKRRLGGVFIKVRALVRGKWYHGEEELSVVHNEKLLGVFIDKDGHPYNTYRYASSLGNSPNFKYYSYRYLEDVAHSCCSACKSTEHLDEVYRILKGGKKYAHILGLFDRWRRAVERKIPEMVKAAVHKEFEGERKLSKFSGAELFAAGVLMKQGGLRKRYLNFLDKKFSPWYVGGMERGDVFRQWYMDWLEREGYREKCNKYGTQEYEQKIFKRWVRNCLDKLDAAGFMLVKKYLYDD